MKSKKIKAMIVFGTRPEAIKMAPLINQFKRHTDKFSTVVCVTAQHREMLDQVLKLFEIIPEHDLNVMTSNQTLHGLTAKVLNGISNIMEQENPDVVMVQGDTTTTFVTGLAAFYQKIPLAHIEAGLRTDNKFSPFPEEINRRLTSSIADLHFTPTMEASENLFKEGIPKEKIYQTGNTVIDALNLVTGKFKENGTGAKWCNYFKKKYELVLDSNKKSILVTGHRRESFGEGFKNICYALYEIANLFHDVEIIYPVHFNPNVQIPVKKTLSSVKNIHLIPPIEYEPFVYLMSRSYIILTDSGGVQEEAPSLGKPVLVMRDTTERPEGIRAGVTKLVGTNKEKIVEAASQLIADKATYAKMAQAVNPYGDGTASVKIMDIILNYMENKR